MQPLDSGDLSLAYTVGSKQEALFQAIRDKIVSGLWHKGGKLPSSRQLAEELSVSRNTVTLVYEQLVAEGYIESKRGSGFYITLELPEHFIGSESKKAHSRGQLNVTRINAPFAPGVPDLEQFPYAIWQRLLQRHLSRTSLLGNQDLQGDHNLRVALSNYLAGSRSVKCSPERIIITAGAQQALSIALMVTTHESGSVLMEQPGYAQMTKVMKLLGLNYVPVKVEERIGLNVEQAIRSAAKALYITPSNQYPMGTTLDTEQRLKLIDWATRTRSWIIEDDYDSEFQFAHRPYTSLQGLAGQISQDDRVIYIGSFSKVMFNGLRLGYMVVPEPLLPKCLEIKDALSGDSPTHTQAALADFISEGYLLRHIRKMRRLYKSKYEHMVESVATHFGDAVEVVSQPAGMHLTLKWVQGINEDEFVELAEKEELIVRALGYYEFGSNTDRKWNGAVLGFGNIALDQIDSKVSQLAKLFYR
ncbi:PLP-dependent aminotransferase family protein [Vibrio hannami]|uniref:MocR-like pyridoxine biosynthesis transcription factor PdxR n=1 Tax=Vibrio hannami TaxID=2717094 RepID=UPI00240FAF9A|nr:PLP-dependent aminotransferase family protein [Vibrio hannami]MDG3085201.1 PLP-dependent aminotransferase family protein [Vibrio hannami]